MMKTSEIKPYSAPVLTLFGDMVTMTASGTGSMMEGSEWVMSGNMWVNVCVTNPSRSMC